MKELLEVLAKALVDDPSSVHVEQWIEDGVVHLDLEVAEEERGRVIGRQGRTAAAVRTLAAAAAELDGIKVSVDFSDE